MKVLHLYTALDDGGVERFLLNYYQNMNRDKVRFDVVVPGYHVGILEEKFQELGSSVYHVPRLSGNLTKHVKEVYRLIKDGKYDIVHCHGYKSCMGLVLAWLCKVKVRIVHSHMAFETESKLRKCKRNMVAMLCKRLANYWFACGEDAGAWLFGRKNVEKGKVKIVYNAIGLSEYAFSNEKRAKLREELKFGDNFVVGNVARFSYQKNQEFLVEVLREIVKTENNVLFVFVGTGDTLESIKEMAEEYDVCEKMLFLGARDDVQELLSAMDFFVLPSRYEGLGIALIEAQVAGLNCLASIYVPREAKITNSIEFLDIENPSEWSDKIISYIKKERKLERTDTKKMELYANYDIITQAKVLQELYEKMTVLEE